MSFSWEESLTELARRRTAAEAMGGATRVAKEHEQGRLTVRERLERLLDEGSFQEVGALATTPIKDADGNMVDLPTTFVCGLGRIDGRPIAVGGEDYTVEGGSTTIHLERLKGGWGGWIEELAYEYKIPLVLLLNGVGGSVAVQETKGYSYLVSGMRAWPVLELLDRVPVVTAVLGPTAGSSAARAVCSHFSLMSRKNGCVFAGGPPLVERSLGQSVDKFELGGSDVHAKQSGAIDNAVDTEDGVFDQIRRFLSYLPRNVWEAPPDVVSEDPADRACDEILAIVSESRRRVFDPRRLVETVVDADSWFELGPEYAESLRVGLARMNGHSVGVLANDPRFLGGALDGPASDKQTRFVEMCDAFHLPILYFVDVPGFMVGVEAERSGVLRRGVRALQALHRASVPVVTVQVRRSYGLAGQATGNPNRLGLKLAFPSGEWGDMPVEGGVAAAYRRDIDTSEDPAARRRELEERMHEQTSPWKTAEKFGVEDIIDPRDVRKILNRWLDVAVGAREIGPKSGPQVRP